VRRKTLAAFHVLTLTSRVPQVGWGSSDGRPWPVDGEYDPLDFLRRDNDDSADYGDDSGDGGGDDSGCDNSCGYGNEDDGEDDADYGTGNGNDGPSAAVRIERRATAKRRRSRSWRHSLPPPTLPSPAFGHFREGVNPCSLAYVVSREGAAAFLRHVVRRGGFPRATDGNFNDYLEAKGIFYGSRRVLATVNASFGSNIF